MRNEATRRWQPWRAMRYVVFLLAIPALVLLAADLLMGDSAAGMPGNLGGMALLVVGAVTALILVLAVHEAGHVIGGRLAGFYFMLVIAGPLKISRSAGRMSFGFNSSLTLMGGVTVCMPDGGGHSLARRMALLLAGGPLMSLLVGAVALLGYGVAAPFIATNLLTAFGAALALMVGVGSLAMALVTAFPWQIAGVYSDGARVLALLKRTPAAARWSALNLLSSMDLAGQRPREWDPDLVIQSTARPDNSLDYVSGAMYAYYAALDRGDAATAGQWLVHALDRLDALPKAFRAAYRVEAAYFAGRWRQDPDRARALLDQVGDDCPVNRASRLRAEAALLLAEGDRAAAVDRAREGLVVALRGISRGTAIAEHEWLTDLIARAEAGEVTGRSDARRWVIPAETTAALQRIARH
jgi:hypothetical protein